MVYRLADGERTEGYYKQGKKHGLEIYFRNNGERWVTQFENGEIIK
jgi:hypothetical protein